MRQGCGSGANDFADPDLDFEFGCNTTKLLEYLTLKNICLQKFRCTSGSSFDPDSMTLWIRIRIELKCWVRIRIEVNPEKEVSVHFVI
jgi:hypothetical protein